MYYIQDIGMRGGYYLKRVLLKSVIMKTYIRIHIHTYMTACIHTYIYIHAYIHRYVYYIQDIVMRGGYYLKRVLLKSVIMKTCPKLSLDGTCTPWFDIMQVCMYVCMRVCVFVCVCVCMYVCMNICVCVCMYA